VLALELFAGFEASVIDKIELTSGEMSKIIRNNYDRKMPFQNYEDRFVKNKDDFSSLNRIKDLLENKIDNTLY